LTIGPQNRTILIMSSLLGSIFGRKPDEATNQDLFDKSKALPERPQHKTVSVPISKKSKRAENEDTINHADGSNQDQDDDHQKLKKQKKKKHKSSSKNKDDTIDGTIDDKREVEQEGNNSQSINENSSMLEKKDEERTIFVGNLSLSITRKSLATLFKDCGPIASCRIRSVPVTGIKLPQDHAGNQRLMKKICVNTNQIDKTLTDTVQGYVVFKNIDTVAKALELNNKLVYDDMRIRVDRATPTVDPTRSVFIGNLPYGAKESTLQDHFRKGCLFEDGDVVGVRIVRDKETFQCKGFGYVLFHEKNMVPTALKLHESTYMKKTIRVMVCGKRFKGRKGGTAQPKYKPKEETGKVSVGAFRRIIAKQQKDASVINKRKRGEKKKNTTVIKAAAGGLSKRAALDKKVEKKVKKLQKRVSKGMGKTKSR